MAEIGSNRLAVLAADIRTAHAGVETAAMTRAERALDAGRALLEAKSLVKHGQWLPWLKEHCGFPERTAQLYMKLAELDLPAELIAALGMQQAAQTTIVCGTAPDYLTFYDEPTEREWLLFGLYVGSWEHVEWLMRNGWASPGAWLADKQYRQRWGMKEPGEAFLQGWAAHKERHCDTPRDNIEESLKSATVADLPGHRA
jgi:Protein of unknown function (DUF3102)